MSPCSTSSQASGRAGRRQSDVDLYAIRTPRTLTIPGAERQRDNSSAHGAQLVTASNYEPFDDESLSVDELLDVLQWLRSEILIVRNTEQPRSQGLPAKSVTDVGVQARSNERNQRQIGMVSVMR